MEERRRERVGGSSSEKVLGESYAPWTSTKKTTWGDGGNSRPDYEELSDEGWGRSPVTDEESKDFGGAHSEEISWRL